MYRLRGFSKVLAVLVLAFYAFFSIGVVALASSHDLGVASPGTASGGGETDSEPAEGSTLFPTTKKSESQCEMIMLYVNYITVGGIEPIKADVKDGEELKGSNKTIVEVFGERGEVDVPTIGKVKYTDIMACAIITGDVKLWMLPFIVRYMLEFVIGLAGLLSVGGIVYGGYLYLFAGIGDDKDKGKNAIKNSLIGLVLTLTAWGIVNIVIALVTF